MCLGGHAWSADPKRHIGILGVGEDEVLRARRIGMDVGEFLVKGFHLAAPIRDSTVSIVCRNTFALCRSACTSFGHKSISRVATTPARPTTVGTEMATLRIP